MSPALTGSSESVSSNPGGSLSGTQLQQSLVPCDRQFVTIVSEKQARVVALPSQNCVYKYQISDADFVVKSEVISIKGSYIREISNWYSNRAPHTARYENYSRILHRAQILCPGWRWPERFARFLANFASKMQPLWGGGSDLAPWRFSTNTKTSGLLLCLPCR